MKSISVLHIAVHLGGGVGRSLSQIARHRRAMGSCVEDVFVCLEAPKTALYADIITGSGAKLYVAPGTDELNALVAAADIVQLEWWHDPVLAAWMNQWKTLLARLVVWVHISGLHYPAIPPDFACLPYACLLTSKVSLLQFEREHRTLPNICEVVNSSGGFDDLPMPKRVAQLQPRFGYLGSLNPAKLHPDIVTYLNAVDLPGFTVDFYGDASTNPQLRSWAQDAARPTPRSARLHQQPWQSSHWYGRTRLPAEPYALWNNRKRAS